MARAGCGNPERAQSADEILFKKANSPNCCGAFNCLMFYRKLRNASLYVRQNK
jgi:hypothetical protein